MKTKIILIFNILLFINNNFNVEDLNNDRKNFIKKIFFILNNNKITNINIENNDNIDYQNFLNNLNPNYCYNNEFHYNNSQYLTNDFYFLKNNFLLCNFSSNSYDFILDKKFTNNTNTTDLIKAYDKFKSFLNLISNENFSQEKYCSFLEYIIEQQNMKLKIIKYLFYFNIIDSQKILLIENDNDNNDNIQFNIKDFMIRFLKNKDSFFKKHINNIFITNLYNELFDEKILHEFVFSIISDEFFNIKDYKITDIDKNLLNINDFIEKIIKFNKNKYEHEIINNSTKYNLQNHTNIFLNFILDNSKYIFYNYYLNKKIKYDELNTFFTNLLSILPEKISSKLNKNSQYKKISSPTKNIQYYSKVDYGITDLIFKLDNTNNQNNILKDVYIDKIKNILKRIKQDIKFNNKIKINFNNDFYDLIFKKNINNNKMNIIESIINNKKIYNENNKKNLKFKNINEENKEQ